MRSKSDKKPMVKRILLIVGMGVALTMLVCCVAFFALELYKPFPLFPPEKGPMPYWVDKMIHDPACDLPCWENITPGETLIEEVPSLLFQIPQAKRISGPWNFDGGRSSHVKIEWFMAADKVDQPDFWCSAYAKDSNAVVSILDLHIDADVYTDVSLAEAIDGFGEPSYLQIENCDVTFCQFRLVYPENGLVLEVFLRDFGQRARLTEKSSISALVLIPTGLQSYSDYLLFRRIADGQYPLIPWQGYGEYTTDGEFTP
jgi:hypothetical protein